jgi:hypothetical protein
MSPDRAHEAVGGARGTESLQTPRWREMDSNYWYRVRVLLGVHGKSVHLAEIFASQDATLGMRTKPFAILRFGACIERRLVARDALDGLTSRTLRER